ncbi:MAG TPA: 16S rRNA (guanine(527)-N(7))-methyltransferase RsmG [Streptosporangiaceae bacterium]|nr:16S rRNA (guanine(527)-N(7))-methyltransferase RsmG [Streptosporangiaceae bacterium]
MSPSPPASAREVFGSVLPLAERYAAMLAGDGVVRGLIGPRETERLWDRHLLNCAVVAGLVPRRSELLDIGSGAGLPGLVLAMLLPDVRVTLVEPMARRVAFLSECVTGLGLANVTVCRARAEEVHGRLTADVVTARAVAPLDRLAGLAVPLLRAGGVILALKGERAEAEAEAAGPELRRLGVGEVSVLRAGTGLVSPAATVVRLTVSGSGRRAAHRQPAATARTAGRQASGRGGRAGRRGGSPPG